MALSDLTGNPFAALLGGTGQGLSQGLGQQQGQWQVTPQAQREALRSQRAQQSGLLNQQVGQWNIDENPFFRPRPCSHEIVDGACKHCSKSAVTLVAKALTQRRKKEQQDG